jgi:hypothetical protein
MRKPITINYFLQVLRIWEDTNIVISKEKIICDFGAVIWSVWAPLRCKMATWLFVREGCGQPIVYLSVAFLTLINVSFAMQQMKMHTTF